MRITVMCSGVWLSISKDVIYFLTCPQTSESSIKGVEKPQNSGSSLKIESLCLFLIRTSLKNPVSKLTTERLCPK